MVHVQLEANMDGLVLMLKKILQAGARLLDFDIFNSVSGENAEPIIANGIEKGQIIHSKNTLKFEDVAKVIVEYAFSDNYVSNHTDPLFLNFNIKVENNFYTLNKLADIIFKYMDGFLLPKKYSYQKQILGNSPIDELSNKIIIFADKDFENSRFNELVNSSSQKNFMKILDFKKDVEGAYNHDELIDFNKKYISICKPLNASENYDPFIWVYGCQFVCINYGIENHMNILITLMNLVLNLNHLNYVGIL